MAQKRCLYASSSFISMSINTPSTPQLIEKQLASLERYFLTLTKKLSTTTRHGSRLRILAQHQLYQKPLTRTHQQYQHQRNMQNTQIAYSNTNTMHTNMRRKTWSKRYTKQELWRYITLLQPSPMIPFFCHTTIASLCFVLSILLSLWNTSKPTMEMSSPNNYKKMILHWIHNGSQVLPLYYY